MQKHLIIILGATASGKTSLGIAIAQHFNTVILSADSRQFYQEMSIGTAKPTPDELAAAPHYFIDTLSIKDNYSVGDFERDSIQLLNELFEKHDVVVMVGGSGLFIKAVCEGLDTFPDVPTEIRERLIKQHEEEGIEALQSALKIADPVYYEKVDKQNAHRLIRALEIYEATGKPFSSFQNQAKVKRNFTPIKIAIDWDRTLLYDRINRRVDLMLKEGLEAEARKLLPFKAFNALQTVGYQEWFDYFDGKIDKAEAIRLIKRNSRRYAKRQLTWFRKDETIQHFTPKQPKVVLKWLEEQVKNQKNKP